MNWSVEIAPLLPLPVLGGLAVAALLLLIAAARLSLRGWALRGLAMLALLAALLDPAIQTEAQSPEKDVVFLVSDQSNSQTLGERAAVRDAAIAALQDQVSPEDFEVVAVDAKGSAEQGTRVLEDLQEAALKYAPDRIAGAIVVSDGQITAQTSVDFPAPVHLLSTAAPQEFDRRLEIIGAPAYGIVGEQVEITLKVTQKGPFPDGSASVPVEISIDGGAAQAFRIPVDAEATLSLALTHAGANLLTLRVPEVSGEITFRNNAAVLSINGVQDRLRALLVSGEPYAGERTWRNFLKSDPSLDLVHFTILRPPNKLDNAPVYELSLIAFPTRELFLEKISDFDLIIFDRYPRRGILPDSYLQNVVEYVDAGGALLVTAGPHFATADSLAFSPLEQVLPARPTGRVYENGYKPLVADLGRRHPVTRDLPDAGNDVVPPAWGPWYRLVQLQQTSGNALLTGTDDWPLLLTDRVGEGRVALLASDSVWLWARGVGGGGPHQELLRRLSHWLMKQPELDEETLTASTVGNSVKVERRSMSEMSVVTTYTAPSGAVGNLSLAEEKPGVSVGTFEATETGLYKISDGNLSAVVAVGFGTDAEFADPIGTYPEFAAAIAATGGAQVSLSDGMPQIRRVAAGRPTSGANWIGLVRREAYRVTDIQRSPLVPSWVLLILALGFSALGWWREGR